MKIHFTNSSSFFFLLYIIILSLTLLQSSEQDFTSVIDFDLTVIHNSLQLVSNEYPDYTDHTAYSQFLINGIVYKIVNLFDQNLITNIKVLTKSENPEIYLQKLYIISRVINSTILLITLIFIFKILGKFNIKSYLKYFVILLIVLTETFWANFMILRADAISICFFWISFYFLLDFINTEKIINLFYVSFFMVLSLLAKVQIIFLFMFMFFFFLFFFTIENTKSNVLYKNGFLKNIKIKFEYFLLLIIGIYFLFQLFLNNFINSSSGVGYFDTFMFLIYFLIMYLTITFVKLKIFDAGDYFYKIFTTIFLFSTFQVIILKLLDIINLLKIDFNIIFSITNPFYFLKAYSTFLEKDFSVKMFFEMITLLFKNPKFDLIYLFLLLMTLIFSIYKSNLINRNKVNYNFVYVILFCLITSFLIAMNNFRYLLVYNLYIIPNFFILIAIFLNSFDKRKHIIYAFLFLIFLIGNLFVNINKNKLYIVKPSNFKQVCSSKPIRDFYYNWARNFNEDFFKKICKNKKIVFK